MVVWELVTVIGNILLFYIFFQVFSFSQLKLKRDNISFLCENFAALSADRQVCASRLKYGTGYAKF
jgi:hypothetical protein